MTDKPNKASNDRRDFLKVAGLTSAVGGAALLAGTQTGHTEKAGGGGAGSGKMNIVLVHGAWHDGSLWKGVADPLKAMGHNVHTPTLAGNGPGKIDRTIGHDAAVASAVKYVKDNNLTDFVLLGHSYGGTIISKMAEALPKRIRRLIYWNAFVLKDGESIDDVSPPHYKGLLDHVTVKSGAGKGGAKLPFPVWREAFMNDAPVELAKKTYDWTTPHPRKTLSDRLELKKFYSLKTPRSYINCTEDIAMPPGKFAWYPRFAERLGLCRVVQLPGSHEVMFSNPKLLAEKIVVAGRD